MPNGGLPFSAYTKALVNPNYVVHYQQRKPSETSYVVMRDTARLPVAWRRVEQVIQVLDHLLGFSA